ncbi:protein kinase [Saccharomonospora sp. NPDC046836]|uniref:serine/threonine protein kinase n=1 Tax=Saccharomonospora sp. NPDC046836 TaxID=3156921 RepID=UPI0033E7D677
MYIRKGTVLARKRYSTIYSATPLGSLETVVVKQLRDTLDRPLSLPGRRKLQQALERQARLISPHVLPLYEIDLTADPPYYVMPRADYSLSEYAEFPVCRTPEKSIDLFAELVHSVAALHAQGVCHGNLKPTNVLRHRNRWTLSDLGVWRHRAPEVAALVADDDIATIAYRAPEQLADPDAADESSDIYSLGRILCYLLTKNDPWPGVDVDHLPAEVRDIVVKCTQEKPSARYHSAVELLADVLSIGYYVHIPEQSSAPDEIVRGSEARFLGGDSRSLGTLAETLRSNVDDAQLYHHVVPRLSERVIRALAERYPAVLTTIACTYFQHIDRGTMQPEYADIVGAFARKVFLYTSDIDTKELCIKKVLDVAYEHNRFSVADIFIELAQRCMSDGIPILVAATPDEVEMVSNRILGGNFPPSIKRLVT